MQYDEHVAAVELETAALADALENGSADALVPTCPAWRLADLATHVGEVSGFWTHVLCEGSGRAKTPYPERPDDPAAMGDWYRKLGSHLVSELRATPPGTRVWSWVPRPQTATFVARRCAHELSIHRLDAELASGTPERIDSALAADGIDEIFFMLEAWNDPSKRGEGETVHLHGTDRPDEWLVTFGADGVLVERRHAKADLALRGHVGDLELLLYQRPTFDDVVRFGDDAVLDSWKGIFTFD